MELIISERIRRSFGVEHDIEHVSRELKYYAQSFHAPRVGAHLITCSDETEQEGADAFNQWFAQDLLPDLRLADRAPFRTATLGGRYEWGGAPLAADHFNDADDPEGLTVVFVKINSHVAVDGASNDPRFGQFPRYGADSACCGLLSGLLAGSSLPAAQEIVDDFASEGIDRLAMLRDADIVDPRCQLLFTAIVNTRLQARRIMVDIQDQQDEGPIIYCVAPCVTLNRPGRDGEIICGLYVADHRGENATERYCGLGDDPSKYELTVSSSRLHVTDDAVHERRDARDHRAIVLERWKAQGNTAPLADSRIRTRLEEAQAKTGDDLPHAKIALKALLPILVEVTPVPAALLLFACGAVGIHHVYRMHRLSQDLAADIDAKKVLHEFELSLENLPHEKAKHIVDFLAGHYGS
jgi:hypothetical protein